MPPHHTQTKAHFLLRNHLPWLFNYHSYYVWGSYNLCLLIISMSYSSTSYSQANKNSFSKSKRKRFLWPSNLTKTLPKLNPGFFYRSIEIIFPEPSTLDGTIYYSESTCSGDFFFTTIPSYKSLPSSNASRYIYIKPFLFDFNIGFVAGHSRNSTKSWHFIYH